MTTRKGVEAARRFLPLFLCGKCDVECSQKLVVVLNRQLKSFHKVVKVGQGDVIHTNCHMSAQCKTFRLMEVEFVKFICPIGGVDKIVSCGS